MASQPNPVALLRAASFRISSASKPELPHVAALAAQSLLSCRHLLSNPDLTNQKDSDAAVALHRFNTQITSLLQDRALEGRWAGIVLVKAAIEAGGWETLRKSVGWVRSLLTLLKKPDPPLTRCLAIVTLTRIFMLTWDYPTLIREITTPNLPTFVSTCLNNISSRASASQELKATLESFVQLLPRHPTIFRQHRDAVSKLLRTTFDLQTSSDHVTDLASRISVLLHQCEPKGGASEKWESSLILTIQGAHAMADRAFMCIDEDWQSVTGSLVNKVILREFYNKAQDAKNPSDGPAVQFVVIGQQGLLNHLRLLSAYYAVPTSAPVNSALGAVTDLLTRLMAITSSTNSIRSSVKFNRDASREERDALTSSLPKIHVACMEVLSVILDRYGSALTSVLMPFLDQIVWIFHSGSNDVNVRTATYVVGKKILDLVGQSFTKQTIASLRKYITACCEDLLPSGSEDKKPQASNGNNSNSNNNNNNNNKQQSTMNADTFLKQTSAAPVAQTQLTGLKSAAWDLLPTLLGKLSAERCPIAMRASMDRTAILIRHKDAVIASTLNHTSSAEAGRRGNSLLPLLAREHPTDPEVEVLLRPRMPIIQTGRRSNATEAEDAAMDQDDDQDDDGDSIDPSEYDRQTTMTEEEQRRALLPESERRRVTTILRPSHSPEGSPRGGESPHGDTVSQDMAHAEQNLVNWALNEYVNKEEPLDQEASDKKGKAVGGRAEATEEVDGLVSQAVKGNHSARLPHAAWGHSGDERRGKRQREEGDDKTPAAEKRQRGSAEAQLGDNPHLKGGEGEGEGSEDSDDDFVVPEIVMGADSDEEDE